MPSLTYKTLDVIKNVSTKDLFTPMHPMSHLFLFNKVHCEKAAYSLSMGSQHMKKINHVLLFVFLFFCCTLHCTEYSILMCFFFLLFHFFFGKKINTKQKSYENKHTSIVTARTNMDQGSEGLHKRQI